GGNDQRGETDRDLLLGDEEDRVRPWQEQAYERSRRQLGTPDPQRLPAPSRDDDAEHHHADDREANPGAEDPWDRLSGQLDAEVGRAPDDVDRPEGDPNPGLVAHVHDNVRYPLPHPIRPPARDPPLR